MYMYTNENKTQFNTKPIKPLICLFGKWYDPEVLKYKTYCTNNTLNTLDIKRWQEKKK